MHCHAELRAFDHAEKVRAIANGVRGLAKEPSHSGFNSTAYAHNRRSSQGYIIDQWPRMR